MIRPVAQGSIRRRLLLLLLAGAALLAVVVYYIVFTVARDVAQDSQDNVLAASASSILDSARFSGGRIAVDLPYAALSMLDTVSQERVFYAIRLQGELLSGYADLPEARGSTRRAAAFVSAQFLGEDVRVVTARRGVSTDTGPQVVQVSVAQTLSGQKQTLAGITRLSIAIGAGFFLLSGTLAAGIARSTIRPLDRLTLSVSRRGPQDLRPVKGPVPSEMVPLVSSLNSLMRRLSKSLNRSEDFIAEAAHRVRTPLAIVRTKAEICQRRAEDPQMRAALREMIRAIDDSSRTAGQLLDHAMVTFRLDHLEDSAIDLPQLVQDTVERLRPVSDLKDIDITADDLAPATLRGDPILLQNALHNLLDNAVKYAPEGARITVRLHHGPEGAALRIIDTGPGFPAADLGGLTRRFTRGSNVGDVVGSGLGLTIVKDIVEAHGGRLEISNTPEGGACGTLFFPLR